MGIIAQTSNTVGSVLGAIATAANMVDRTIGASADGVDMLAARMHASKVKQATDITIELDNYTVNALLSSSAEQQRFEETILRDMHGDPVRKKHFDAIHARLAKLFEPKP